MTQSKRHGYRGRHLEISGVIFQVIAAIRLEQTVLQSSFQQSQGCIM
jgi:hypothetical protein